MNLNSNGQKSLTQVLLLKRLLTIGTYLCVLFSVAACAQANDIQMQSGTEVASTVTPDSSSDTGSELLSKEEAQAVLASYLEDNWGFSQERDDLINGSEQQINGADCYVFEWIPRDMEGRDSFLYQFGITKDFKTVYFFNEDQDAWFEDVNP